MLRITYVFNVSVERSLEIFRLFRQIFRELLSMCAHAFMQAFG
jgi:hypothetical protein